MEVFLGVSMGGVFRCVSFGMWVGSVCHNEGLISH